MKIQVINSKVYGNPYQSLLYSAIGSKYQLASGSLSSAITQQIVSRRSIYHIHWEDALFARCGTVAQAVKVRRQYVEKLRRYVSLGGKVVWTLHNIKPHEWRYVQTFLSLRKDLASLSHRILVHNQATKSTLQDQTGLNDLSKVSVLPHPAYFDCYEPMRQTLSLAGLPPANPRTLLYFGLVRAYKGIPQLVGKLPSEFMARHELALHICGEPVRADSFLDELFAETRDRADVKVSLGPVPTEHVADLIRSHAGLVIPYHKVLTSGVAVLSLTLGVLTIAPNTAAMRELFPASSHQLLFNPRSRKDFRRAVLALMDMPVETREQMSQDYIAQALKFSPQIVSSALGMIYDELLGITDSGGSISLPNSKPREFVGGIIQSRTPSLLQSILEKRIMATRSTTTPSTALSNQQLAIELVKATLLGNVRAGIPDELILNNVKDADRLTLERARLDGAYSVRLYQNILSRLDKHSLEGDKK